MDFQDCISTAAMTAVDQDAPDHLLPLLIANQAAELAWFDADAWSGCITH